MLWFIVIVVCSGSVTIASPIKKNVSPGQDPQNDAEELLHAFAPLRKQLQIESGLEFSSQSEWDTTFNELDVLRLIPTIIHKLKENTITPSDQKILKSIYGVLWKIIDDEATRLRSNANDRMNPVLEELLFAQNMEMERRKNRQYSNDIERNTVQRVLNHRSDGGASKSNSVDPMHDAMREMKQKMRKDIAPAKQLLKYAALLIHESVMRKQQMQKNRKTLAKAKNVQRPRRLRIFKKQLVYNVTDEGSKIVIGTSVPSDSTSNSGESDLMPNNPVLDMDISRSQRTRRHVKAKHLSNDNDNDDQIELNLLESIINSLIRVEDDGESNEIYDYNDNDDAEQPWKTISQQHVQIDANDYMDYAFDDSDNDADAEDEHLLRAYHAPLGDYEDGSIAELIRLGAKHRLRAQRDSNYLKRLHVGNYLNDQEY